MPWLSLGSTVGEAGNARTSERGLRGLLFAAERHRRRSIPWALFSSRQFCALDRTRTQVTGHRGKLFTYFTYLSPTYIGTSVHDSPPPESATEYPVYQWQWLSSFAVMEVPIRGAYVESTDRCGSPADRILPYARRGLIDDGRFFLRSILINIFGPVIEFL